MKRLALALILSVMLQLGAACEGEPTAKPTLTSVPTATVIAVTPAPTPAQTAATPTPPAPTPVPTTARFPASQATVVPESVPTPVPTPARTTAWTAGTSDPALQVRLDRLAEQLEAKRQQLHIPGMAIAVVKDDEVVMARGFGLADLENEVPVTPETIFAIGSSTKAFTAALIGMLVDEGRMSHDDPVTDYLPFFTLNIDSEDENAGVTIGDLLSHRTGFVRMGILIASGAVPREAVLRTAAGAEPWAPFRERFYYSNVMYLAAGVSAGNAAGLDWDALVARRIFEPLRMTDSSTSLLEAQKDPRLSLGYRWEEALGTHERVDMRSVDNIGPAGAINSNVLDMAQWLRFQLGRGVYEGRRLISEAQHQGTWTSHIEMGPGVGYGLGWILHERKGGRVVEHGGNVPGFSAQVAMLPESNLGFVLLTNITSTPLQAESINMVWDALVGDSMDDDAGATGYDQYIGKYVANFGAFSDEEFIVLVQNGRLAVDVPRQMVYELKGTGRGREMVLCHHRRCRRVFRKGRRQGGPDETAPGRPDLRVAALGRGIAPGDSSERVGEVPGQLPLRWTGPHR